MWWIGIDLFLWNCQIAVKNELILAPGSIYGGFCVRASKAAWFWSGDRNWFDFSNGVEIDLVFMCGIEIELVLTSGSNWLVFCEGVKIEFGFVFGSKITWFYLTHRYWLGSYVRAEALGSEMTWFWCGIYGNSLVLVFGSNSIGFTMGTETDFLFRAGVGIDIFCVGVEDDLFSV